MLTLQIGVWGVPRYKTKNAILEELEVRRRLVLRQVAVLTGTVENLDTWKSKKGLIMGKLDLELNEGILIRALIFPDYWEKLKTHLENGMEITAVGKVNVMDDYVILISSVTLFPIPKISQGEKWLDQFLKLVKQQQEREYKPGWLIYRLKELNPPLSIWKLCAQYLGRKEGWGFYQWRELNPKEKRSIDLHDYDRYMW